MPPLMVKHGKDREGNEFGHNKVLRIIPEGEKKLGINGSWYCIEKFHKHHPGGDILLEYSGRDVTVPFKQYHTEDALNRVKKIGTYELDLPPADLEWMEMEKEFRKRGYFKKPPKTWVFWKIVSPVFLLALSVYLVQKGIENWISYILSGVFLGMFWRQNGFLMHYLEHDQIFESRYWNRFWGNFCGTGCAGLNSLWWRLEHNEHHLFTCSYVDDYQLTDPSFCEKTWVANDQAAKILLKELLPQLSIVVQHWFYILGCTFLGRPAIMLSSWTGCHIYRPEFLAGTFHAAYISAIFMLFPNVTSFLGYYFIATCIQGILAFQLTLSHTAMPYKDKKRNQIDERV